MYWTGSDDNVASPTEKSISVVWVSKHVRKPDRYPHANNNFLLRPNIGCFFKVV